MVRILIHFCLCTCNLLPLGNAALQANTVEIATDRNRQSALLVPLNDLLGFFVLGPGWCGEVIRHVLVEAREEILVGHRHDGTESTHLGFRDTIGKDSSVTGRARRSFRQTLLGLDDLRIAGIQHIQLELLDLGVGELGVYVSSSGVLLEVSRIKGIVLQIVLGNVHVGLGSRRNLADGHGRLPVLADHVLVVGVGQLVEVVGIFGPEIKESLDRIKGLFGHLALERAFDPSSPGDHWFHRGFLGRFDARSLFGGDGAGFLEFLSVFLPIVGREVGHRAIGCCCRSGNNRAGSSYGCSAHHFGNLRKLSLLRSN
mmetsp:Transcript_4221/g.8764  ORF Transcript_4221/g.8764 Transcript_4221/m.8764 type:complete len:314 (+) Transcript_4221:73-1014(+)